MNNLEKNKKSKKNKLSEVSNVQNQIKASTQMEDHLYDNKFANWAIKSTLPKPGKKKP